MVGPWPPSAPFLADGLLHRVKDAPEFSHSAYAVYATQRENETFDRVRSGLRMIAAESDKPALLGESIGSRPLPLAEAIVSPV